MALDLGYDLPQGENTQAQFSNIAVNKNENTKRLCESRHFLSNFDAAVVFVTNS